MQRLFRLRLKARLRRPVRALAGRWRGLYLALCLAAGSLPQAQGADLHGAGSTFVDPVMVTWAAGWHAQTGAKVIYHAIGSGGGIKQIKQGMLSFGASDKPLTPEDAKAAGLAQFPLVVGGVVPVVNLPGIASGQLNFTGELLADIYLGKIRRWNDPAIAALSPDVVLPDLAISVMHRADSSGSTFNWSNYLSKRSAAWKQQVGEGTLLKWPRGSAVGGNEGMARAVAYLPGAIGYVELAYATERKLTVARVRNQSGVFVTPSSESFQAAATHANWDAPDFFEILTDAPGAQSWPITATVFVLMPRRSADADKSAEALRFFRWALRQGQAAATKLNYAPLPAELVQRIEAYWQDTVR